MSTRSRKEEKQYKKYRRSFSRQRDCVFCEIDEQSAQFISQTKSFKVIKNIFGYTQWDGQDVEDHLMIVPKKHINTLSGLGETEALEFVKLMSSFESRGYNVWARAPQSLRKTVVHQHTHLIKPGGKIMKYVLFVHRPYLRFMH